VQRSILVLAKRFRLGLLRWFLHYRSMSAHLESSFSISRTGVDTHFNCDGSVTTGCESFLPCCSVASDCIVNGWPQVLNYTCTSAVCGISTCSGTYGNCDTSALNGCETNLANTVSQCGACGNDCDATKSTQVATTTCTGGNCAVVTCAASSCHLIALSDRDRQLRLFGLRSLVE
jgi:hypothetical protein